VLHPAMAQPYSEILELPEKFFGANTLAYFSLPSVMTKKIL
jgi:hypothetical protein